MRKDVVDMKDMKKDETIERAFRNYFDGNETPAVDLTQAKRAVGKPEGARRRGIFWKVASSLACVLLVAAVAVGLILPRFAQDVPQDSPAGEEETAYYSLASAQATPTAYADLEEDYGEILGGLPVLGKASNASAGYTLYSVDGQNVLLSVHIEYMHALSRWQADVSFDLTDGKELPEELASFQTLSSGGSIGGYSYSYDTRTWNGERVMDARLVRPDSDCYLTVMGQGDDAMIYLLSLITKNA